MDSSDSGGEGDEPEARGRSQMDQAAQEEDFSPFVNNPSEDDYKPTGGNNLLGNPDEGACLDDASSSDSLLDWLMSFEPTESVTAGRREPPSRGEVSQVNPPSHFRSSSEINVNSYIRGSNAKEAYTPSARLPTGGNMKNGQRRVECPHCEPRFTRPPRSEQRRTEALLEAPPTRGQKRERSRSPDQSRTRARFESMPLPRSLGLQSWRLQHSSSSLRSGSVMDQLNSATQTENVTSGQREHQRGRDVSKFNPHSDFRSSSEINVNSYIRGSNAKEANTPSARLPTGGNMKNGQRRVECPHCEPRFTRPPRSEQRRTEALLEAPPTRGQKRERSRSPDQSRTRARFESMPLPRSLGLQSWRLQHSSSSLRSGSVMDQLNSATQTENVTSGQREHQRGRDVSKFNPHSDFRSSSEINVNSYIRGSNAKEANTPSARLPTGGNMKNGQRRVECPHCEPRFTRPPRSEQRRTEALLEAPPTRGQKRERSRSPDQSRTRARFESMPLPRSLGLQSWRLQHSSSSLRSGSVMDQLNSATQTENVTSGQREHQRGRDVSKFNPHSDFRSSSEINVNSYIRGSNAKEANTPSARLPTGGNMKNGQRRVECPHCEPRFTRPPRSEQRRTEALLEAPPTRGQKRERSRSPDQSRTRARFESMPLPRSLGLQSWRLQHSSSSLRSGSVMDQLNSATQTENVTSGQREHQRGRDVSKFNPHSDFRSSSEINVNSYIRGSNAKEANTPSARLPTGGNMKNGQRRVECPHCEPRFTRPPRSEQRRTEALLEAPPTRGQKRERSRSPDQSRTRARFESMPLPRSLGLQSWRLQHSSSSLRSGSVMDQLNSATQTENVTSGQREHQRGRDVSKFNPHSDFRSSSEINVNSYIRGSNAKEANTPSARLPTGGNMKNGQRRVECPHCEPRFTRPPRSEQRRTEALLEAPPTRGQKRERSRSPDQSRTRARFESMPLPRSLGLQSWRLQHSSSSLRSGSVMDQLNSATQTENVTSGQREHQRGRDVSKFNPHSDFRSSSEINVNSYIRGSNAKEAYTPSARLPTGGNMKNGQRRVECPHCEPRFTRPPRSEQRRTEALLEAPPTRGQKRERSRSPDQSGTRARTESRPPAQSLGELLPRLHHSTSSPTVEQPAVRETERFSRTQYQETLTQQTTVRELQKWVLLANSKRRNAIQGESSSDTTSDDESYHLRQMNPTMSYSERGQVHPVAYSERESVTRRTQRTFETPSHTITLESEQEGFRHIFSYHEQGDNRAYIRTIGISMYRTSNTGLNDTTSGAIPSMLSLTRTDFSDSGSLLDSDSDSESSLSLPSPNTERAETSSGSDSSQGSRGLGSNSVCSDDYYPCFRLISSSESSYTLSSNSSLTSSSSSSDESSELPMVFESSDEDDASLDDHRTGLSEAQIDNLAIRSSVKNDTLKECIICMTEYREGSQLRILPCFHEFHVHCIDLWLSDNSTCPICRWNILDSGERENTN